MKRLIAICAFALSGAVFASTSMPPPNVDTTGWDVRTIVQNCNGVTIKGESFSMKDERLERVVNYITVGDTATYQYHFWNYVGEYAFTLEVHYLNDGNTWTRYSADELQTMEEARIIIMEKFFPDLNVVCTRE